MRGILFILFGLVILIAGCSKPSYISDEIFLRARYAIHSDVKTLECNSSPPDGLFGREHLCVLAAFQFNDAQLEEFMSTNKVTTAWNSLPIPDRVYVLIDEIDSLRKADLKRFDRIKHGYFRCETAAGQGIFFGNDKPHPFMICPPANPDKDFVLAVLDQDQKIVYVVAVQNY